jgi:hypothetical protein
MLPRRLRNIRQLTDISGRCGWEDGTVQITIWKDGGRPLRGRVGVGNHPPVAFEGWLELLSALESALGADTSTDGLGGELDPGAQGQLPQDVGDVSGHRSP